MNHEQNNEKWEFFQDKEENGKWRWKLTTKSKVHISAKVFDSRELCEDTAQHYGYVKTNDK
jgi:hypothetical protein